MLCLGLRELESNKTCNAGAKIACLSSYFPLIFQFTSLLFTLLNLDNMFSLRNNLSGITSWTDSVGTFTCRYIYAARSSVSRFGCLFSDMLFETQ